MINRWRKVEGDGKGRKIEKGIEEGKRVGIDKKIRRGLGKETGIETRKETGKEAGKEIGKDAGKEIGKETGEETGKEIGKETRKAAGIKIGKAGMWSGCLRWFKRYGVTALVMIGVSCILQYSVAMARQARLQQGIAEEVLRFHVLANSDSDEDQRIKLQVRDRVLAWVEEEMDKGAVESGVVEYGKTDPSMTIDEMSSQAELLETKETVMEFLSSHLQELEAVADTVLEENGVDYRSSAAIERCYFPDRTYGDCTFPAGWYEALRICLGEAQGHNWWCVLYPRLCFADSLHAVVGEEEMEKLEEVLTVEEYESLLRHPGRWKISFRWF